ncbi:hypothetical protein ETAA1_59110 [Urbifossiella limnaea]|uniref:Uncharacterized protein n=1 Tax=Urbifossiella limnaea TaxID=2528023 RepID=A0A517Y2A8_9BACT|nr:hypothetical protein ETAA1_59110 [Urbifossiella limnaea]
MPPRPCRRNANGLPASGKPGWSRVIAVVRWSPRTDGGISRPCISASFGFGSNRSVWLGPPDWNR